MNRIKTTAGLRNWVENQVWLSTPRRRIPRGFVAAFRSIFGLFESFGHFELYGVPEREMDDLWTGKRIKASVHVIELIAAIYGRAIVQSGAVSLMDLIWAVAPIVKLEPGDLRICKRRIASSRNFERRFDTKIRVRLKPRDRAE